MKDYPITIGFDDAKFRFDGQKQTTPLIGVVCQGTRVVKVVKKEILIDGDDSTDAIIDLVRSCENNVQYILTHTITFGGFNIADIEEIYQKLETPIIAFTERMVNLDDVKKAIIKKFPNQNTDKINKIIKAGNLYEMKIKTHGGYSTVYFHSVGVSPEKVKILMEKVSIDSKLPEPVRIAHLIGASFEI